MARYPTFEDYETSRNFKDGIKRCDDLLKKHPKDVYLLSTKLQLLAADKRDIKPILDELLAINPPVRDIGELFTINDAVVRAQQNVWPRARSVGPEASKLWDNAIKASSSTNSKLELLIQRYESAVQADHMVDAQQALIQLKAMQPKNRVIYMAHAAVTQLTSTTKEDMQSRLALMLAKKAVTEKFDEEKDLDCRVPGQIFALQSSTKDLEGIRDTRFAESRETYEVLRDTSKSNANGAPERPEPKDATTVSPSEWLDAEIAVLKSRFAELVQASAGSKAMLSFAASAMRLFNTSIHSMPSARSRTKGETCFLAISALVKAYTLSHDLRPLLLSARLAEILLRLDPHIHEGRLILVYLYTRLNLGSLALHYFDSLNIKEVQLDTVGHALFTNLPLIYPHRLPTGKKEASNPLSRAKGAVQVYARCEQRLAESACAVLSNGQTGMLFELQALRGRLRASVTKRIVFLEIRRQARLLLSDCNWHAGELGPDCVANWIETEDNRDFAATFDYGFNVEKALHGIPGRVWMLYGLAADVAWCLASGKEVNSPISDPEALLAALADDLPDVAELSFDSKAKDSPAVSDAEHLAGDLACRALRLVMLAEADAKDDSALKQAISDAMAAVRRLNIASLCETSDALTERLRDTYAYLDALKVLDNVCEFGAKVASTAHSEALAALRESAKSDVASLRAHAEEQRRSVSTSGIKTFMAGCDEEVFAALRSLDDEEELDGFCAAVEAAANEGWGGVGKVKV